MKSLASALTSFIYISDKPVEKNATDPFYDMNGQLIKKITERFAGKEDSLMTSAFMSWAAQNNKSYNDKKALASTFSLKSASPKLIDRKNNSGTKATPPTSGVASK